MEFKVTEYQLPEKILFNYEELKAELEAKVQHYETLVYTDNQIKDAKADRASLNRLKKALNDERIRMEKEYLTPFNEFKAKVNEIISIIDKPCKVIDDQIKGYEDKKKQEKRTAIEELFTSIGFQSFVKLEMIWDEKWLNASKSLKSIEDEMREVLYRVGNDIATLAKLPEYGFEATEVYKSTLDINRAINEAQKFAEIAKLRAELDARETEKLKAQEEQRKQEEEPQIMAITAEEIKPEQTEQPRQWVAFQANLTRDDAFALKAFFDSRNIEFKRV